MAKTNYSFEKRQKEIARKQKQEEKRLKKILRRDEQTHENIPKPVADEGSGG